MSTGFDLRGRLPVGLLAALLAWGSWSWPVAEATSVKDLSLSELVAEADAIVRVKVTAARSEWGEHHGAPAIVTRYRMRALAPALRGEAPAELTLFGGELGGERMRLEGQPELVPGREYVLLLIQRTDVQCPLVGIWKGCFEVREGQVQSEGRPLVDVVEDRVLLGQDNERGLSPAALWSELAARVAVARKQGGER